jgi:serine/threonine protein kinase
MAPSGPRASEHSLQEQRRAVTIVGRYALYGEIASGGMATVHLGRLLGPVGFARTVAIKRLHAHLAKDPEFVLMFLDEARIAARIRHPNVVPTLDVVSAAGELLLVMEYVPGEALSHLIRAVVARHELMPPRIAATIVSGILHGLHAAHEARSDQGEPLGVVHRDVSPQNVLVGVDGVAHVLDFGVAKAIGRLQSTRSGILKGKIAYMSPEHVRGEPMDRRGDIYSAAVVLWEALAGRRLFKGEDDVQVMRQVLEGKCPPPSSQVPDLPPRLDAITMRGLATDPRERFDTARDMARALEACVGVATPSEIGDWVESMAGTLLAQRARVVADIESGSSSLLDGSPEGLLPEDLQTAVSDVHSVPSVPVSARVVPPAPTPNGRRNLTLASAALLLVAMTAALTALVARHVIVARPEPTGPAPAESASSIPSGNEEAVASDSSEPASPESVSSAAPQDGAPAAVDSKPAPAKHSHPLAQPHNPACNPPFYFDANGVKHYKRECN